LIQPRIGFDIGASKIVAVAILVDVITANLCGTWSDGGIRIIAIALVLG
jgi:hypothetical protein